MLEYIEFKEDRFKKEEDFNVIDFTENTIILCNNCKLMNSLAKEIINTVNGKAEYNDYWCESEDIGKAEIELHFGLQCLIDINGQKITLSLEPSIIYKANKPEEIWLFGINGYNKEVIYPMLIFKGSNQIWEAGKDEVYKNICNGRFGCYDGNFLNLKPDMREKIREYIDELDTEIKRCESELILINSSYTQSCEPKNPQVGEVWIGHSDNKYELQSRINALIEVKNDLLGRLEEVI